MCRNAPICCHSSAGKKSAVAVALEGGGTVTVDGTMASPTVALAGVASPIVARRSSEVSPTEEAWLRAPVSEASPTEEAWLRVEPRLVAVVVVATLACDSSFGPRTSSTASAILELRRHPRTSSTDSALLELRREAWPRAPVVLVLVATLACDSSFGPRTSSTDSALSSLQLRRRRCRKRPLSWSTWEEDCSLDVDVGVDILFCR